MNLSVFGSKNLDFCKEVICFPNNCFRVQKKKQTKNKNLAPPTLKYLITEKYYPILVEIKGKLYIYGLSRPNRSPTTQPNCLVPTQFWPEPKVQSVDNEFPFSRTDTNGLSGGFASPKPEQPKPDQSHMKNLAKSAKTGQIRQDLDQIWRDLNQIQLDLVRFSQIRLDFNNFQPENVDSREKNVDSNDFFQITTKFFANFDEFFQFLGIDRIDRRQFW